MVNWSKHQVWHVQKIGQTTAYNSEGKAVTHRTASPAGTGVWFSELTSNSIKFNIKLEGQNPFCKAGSIFATLDATVHQSGSYSAIARHKLMPNIEAYFAYEVPKKGYWVKTMYRQKLRDPNCLIDHMPQCFTNVSLGG